jgi:acetyltransferase-like isoleucine patch superfamily enzyme
MLNQKDFSNFKWFNVDYFYNETQVAQTRFERCKLQPLSRIVDVNFEESMQVNRNTQVGPNVSVGAYFSMNQDCYIARAKVGRYCSFGARTVINPFGHPVDWLSIHEFQYHDVAFNFMPEWSQLAKRPREGLLKHVDIGNDVWAGHNVVIMGGVKVGDGAILATGTVVTHDVPPYAVVGGVPARIIKYRFSKPIIERLLSITWWNFPFLRLSGLPFDNIEACLDQLEDIRSDLETLPTFNQLKHSE